MYVNTLTEVHDKFGNVKLPSVPHVDETYPVSHLITKGTLKETKTEAMKFTGGSVTHPNLKAWITRIMDEVCDANLTPESCPHVKTFEECMAMKNETASPGEPYRQRYAKFQDMVADLSYDDLHDHFLEMEDAILNDETDISTLCAFLVFSKTDKYNVKKLITKRFRTIQGGNAFLLYMTDKYLSWAGKAVSLHPSVLTSFQLPDYPSRVLKQCGTDWYLSVDFSGFDRSQARNMVAEIVRQACEKSELNEDLTDFFVTTISEGMLVMPDGEVLLRWGGNPSGQGLTTFVNCIVHLVLLHAFDEWALETHEVVVENSPSVCGDDGMYGFPTKAKAEFTLKYLPSFAENVFGIKTGFESTLAGGEVFEFPEIPIFLGRMIAETRSNKLMAVLVDLPRVLATIYNAKWNNHAEKQEKFMGIYVALAGWRILLEDAKRTGEESIIPLPVHRFFKDAHLVLDNPPTYQQCVGWANGYHICE